MTSKEMSRKMTEFGTGEIIYHSEEEFPKRLEHNGYNWHRTQYEYTVAATGMNNYLYETYDSDDDIRLFIDAAGHIWDETELGIF